jgi:hypothetical protein
MESNKPNQGNLGNNKNAKISIARHNAVKKKRIMMVFVSSSLLEHSIIQTRSSGKKYYIIAYFPFTVILVSDTRRKRNFSIYA